MYVCMYVCNVAQPRLAKGQHNPNGIQKYITHGRKQRTGPKGPGVSTHCVNEKVYKCLRRKIIYN